MLIPVTGLDFIIVLPLQDKRQAKVHRTYAFRWVRVRFQQRINPIVNVSFTMGFIGAGDRTRTGTPSLAADFESATSTISSHRQVRGLLYTNVLKIASRNSADSAGEKKYHLQSLRGGLRPPRNDPNFQHENPLLSEENRGFV